MQHVQRMQTSTYTVEWRRINSLSELHCIPFVVLTSNYFVSLLHTEAVRGSSRSGVGVSNQTLIRIEFVHLRWIQEISEIGENAENILFAIINDLKSLHILLAVHCFI